MRNHCGPPCNAAILTDRALPHLGAITTDNAARQFESGPDLRATFVRDERL